MKLPGPKAQALIARDAKVVSPSYPRDYPFAMAKGRGAEVWDVDGNRFLDFAAGIAVCATGHAHPQVVQAMEEAKRAVLASAYLQQIAADIPKPSDQEIKEYYVQHPEYFSARRTYAYRSMAVSATDAQVRGMGGRDGSQDGERGRTAVRDSLLCHSNKPPRAAGCGSNAASQWPISCAKCLERLAVVLTQTHRRR